jgi:hypothetical protein
MFGIKCGKYPSLDCFGVSLDRKIEIKKIDLVFFEEEI